MSKTIIHETVTEKLGYKKLCVHRMSKVLMDNHMQKQMGSVLTFLTHYPEEGDEFLDSTVAGMKPRFITIYRFSQNTKFKTSISARKIMAHFFGIGQAFSWLTSCLKAKQELPMHIVRP